MSRGEAKHLSTLTSIDRVDGHRDDTTATSRPTRLSTRHRWSRITSVRIHRRDEVLARAIVNLNRPLHIALRDIDLAHVHAGGHAGHVYAGFAALALTLDHGRALHLLAAEALLDRDFKVAANRLVVVARALRE